MARSVGESVEQGGWFMWFHIIQIPLTGLIALAVYLLTEGLEGRAVMVSRWAADERSPGWRRPAGYQQDETTGG